MKRPKYITILFVPEGGEARRELRVPTWLLTFGLLLLAGLLVTFAGLSLSYSRVMARAMDADRLELENAELQRYRQKVRLLEANLVQVRDLVYRLSRLAGIESAVPELPPDTLTSLTGDAARSMILQRPVGTDWNLPVGMPVQAFVTKDYQVTDRSRFHPGLDLACAIGTPVLATGGGTIIYSGTDSVYGETIIIQHNDSVSTLYGHNDRLLVASGDRVEAGQQIAVSGNTGRSTAPHVHYEIRINDQPINPLENPYDQETR